MTDVQSDYQLCLQKKLTMRISNPNISEHALVIVPGHGPEALLWIIVDAFLLVAIVTGNSLSIAIILRTGRRWNRNKKSIVKGLSQRTQSQYGNRKQPKETGLHSSEHERKGPEEMARKCRKPPSRSSCFVLSLAISDLLVGLAMPFHMTFYIQGADKGGSICQDEGITLGEIEWTCLLRFVLIALACSASACNLMAIAVDRYLAIVYPLHYNRYMIKRVVGTIIFSCWVSALVFASVPAYWNRWKTAKSCELDEIFTPQYITCVVSPLFSAVVVALTILYWRIGKEARSQLSRLLGADGKGPPWRRCQSGKTYCPSISSTDNQLENSRILSYQYVPVEHENDYKPQNQPTTSGLDRQPSTSQRNFGLASQQGSKSNTVEDDCIEYRNERLEDYYQGANNFHALYKIEEESDLLDDEELDPILLNAADKCKRSNQQLYYQKTSYKQTNDDKPLVSRRNEAEMTIKVCDNGQGNTEGTCGYLLENDEINEEIHQTENICSTNVTDEYKNSEGEGIEVIPATNEHSFALSRCPTKSISKAIDNLKGHFHTFTHGRNTSRLHYIKHVTEIHDSYQTPQNFNNNQVFESKGPLSPNITKEINNQRTKIINGFPQFHCGNMNSCQHTMVQDCQNIIADQESDQMNVPEFKRNYSHASKKSSELILCVNSLDWKNSRTLKNLDDIEEVKKNDNDREKEYKTCKVDETKFLISDLNSGFKIKLEKDKKTGREANKNDNTNKNSLSPENILNTETHNLSDTLSGDPNSEKPFCKDLKLSTSLAKDKSEHHPVLKTRSSSCSSQDDPRSNAWNIRFPSLTSAGTTVRPLSKSTIVVLLVLGSFVLLWLPYIAVCALLVNGFHLPYNIYRATFSLAMSNSGVNPIIYGWKNAELKRVFLRFILRKWHKCYSKYRKKEPTTEPELELHEFT